MVRYRTFVILFVLVLGLLYFFNYHSQYGRLPLDLKNASFLRGEVVDRVSLDKYFENIDEYDGVHTTVLGFLERDSTEYLTDSKGNRIKLVSLRPPQKLLFSKVGKSEEVYGVRGVLNKDGSGLMMEVREIEKVQEIKKNETKTIVKENRTDYIVVVKKKLTELKEGAISIKDEFVVEEKNKEGVLENDETSMEYWSAPVSYERKTQCQEAFAEVNKYRIENGKQEIRWDERAYNLAVARSKDMSERNYFDHVTPEGTCAKDMKAQYEFSANEVLAENAGGMTHYLGGTPVPGTSVMEAVDGWMSSRGHRYNLLYSEHVSGAIGCYQSICLFYGVHSDPYGLGAGPCTTGEQGLAYWNNAGTQEGEVG